MSWRLLGSRSRRAATFSLLCACAILARGASARAEEMVVSDGGCSSGSCYSGADCYGSCDSCTTCNSCNSCDSCGSCGSDCCSGWFGAEYLGWQLDGNRIPALVTRGPLDDYPGTAGQLGQPATVILSGNEEVNDGFRSGYRLFGGFWLDCCHSWGIGADYFDAGNDSYNFTSADPGDGDFITGRPFFNTETGLDDLELVGVPGELQGTAQVKSDDNLQGAGITLNHCLWRCCDPCTGNGSGVSLLSGYRYYKYDTDLSITERLEVLQGTQTQLVPGTTFFVQDRFRTENEFNGGEIGLQGYKKRCWWWVDGMAKLGIGNNTRTVRINGTTIVSVPDDDTAVYRGGLLTSELTNIGRYSSSDFALIPEFRLGVGACLTRCVSVRAGYNVILWNDVVRAGSELPAGLAVDPRNLPPTTDGGGSDPAFPGFRGSQLVAHGLDASVQIQW